MERLPKVLQGVKSFELGESVSSAILENGDLYLWGYNFWGTVGNGTGGWEDEIVCSPTKSFENVVDYQSSYGTSGALTESGDLYMWGNNNDCQVGNGDVTGKPQYRPIKVLENVQSFQIRAGKSGAILNSGELYTWGNSYINSVALENESVPVKILDNVKCFYNYAISGALTESGDLYMWGWNGSGQVGNGNTVDQYSPIKILENIERFKISESSCAALDKEGNLYMWGSNYCYEELKELIDNNIEITYHITKIQEQIMDFDISGGNCGAVTNSGDYYSWNFHEFGKVKMRPTYIVRRNNIHSDATETYSMNGVIVTAEQPLSIGDAVLQVVCVTGSAAVEDSFESVTSIAKDKYKIYDICFIKDNVEQEISTNVTVKMPIPEEFHKNKVLIYTQGKDGTWEKINSRIDGNYLEFQTNHFSLYVIAEFEEGKQNLVSTITLNLQNTKVFTSNKLQLDATIIPFNATNKTLIWSSADPTIAIVDQAGLITGMSAGKTTITVKAQDGSGVEASCIVEVTGGSNNGGGNTEEGSSSGSGDSSSGNGNTSTGGDGSSRDENSSTEGDGSSGGGNSSAGGSGSSGGGNTSTGENSSSGGGNSSTGGNGSSGGGSTSSGGNNTNTGGSFTTPGTGNTSTADEPAIKVLYYIVNFDKNGGTNLSRRKMTLLQDDSLGILPKVERKNYKFLGWYTQPADGKKVTQKTVLNVSTTLHAHWEKIVKPSKEQITSLNSKKVGAVTVKYKRLSGIKGYEIAYSTNKQFTSASTKRVIAGSTGKTLTKLKSGKTYYVKVRAYKTDSTGKKVYGAYSNVRSVQVK